MCARVWYALMVFWSRVCVCARVWYALVVFSVCPMRVRVCLVVYVLGGTLDPNIYRPYMIWGDPGLEHAGFYYMRCVTMRPLHLSSSKPVYI